MGNKPSAPAGPHGSSPLATPALAQNCLQLERHQVLHLHEYLLRQLAGQPERDFRVQGNNKSKSGCLSRTRDLPVALTNVGIVHADTVEVIEMLALLWDLTGHDKLPVTEFVVSLAPLCRELYQVGSQDEQEPYAQVVQNRTMALERVVELGLELYYQLENTLNSGGLFTSWIMGPSEERVTSQHASLVLKSLSATASYLGDPTLSLRDVYKVVDNIFETMTIVTEASEVLSQSEFLLRLTQEPLMIHQVLGKANRWYEQHQRYQAYQQQQQHYIYQQDQPPRQPPIPLLPNQQQPPQQQPQDQPPGPSVTSPRSASGPPSFRPPRSSSFGTYHSGAGGVPAPRPILRNPTPLKSPVHDALPAPLIYHPGQPLNNPTNPTNTNIQYWQATASNGTTRLDRSNGSGGTTTLSSVHLSPLVQVRVPGVGEYSDSTWTKSRSTGTWTKTSSWKTKSTIPNHPYHSSSSGSRTTSHPYSESVMTSSHHHDNGVEQHHPYYPQQQQQQQYRTPPPLQPPAPPQPGSVPLHYFSYSTVSPFSAASPMSSVSHNSASVSREV